MPFDVRQILEQLDAAKASNTDVPKWLEESWADPEGFIAALTAAHTGRGVPTKSRPGEHYDFFQDLVGQYADTERIAFRAFDRIRGWQTLSYRQLHDRASRRAAEWAEQGVKPGAAICLLYGPGPELIISLMAALRLGVCFTLLPPQGMRFVSRRLAALKLKHIAAEPHQTPLLKGFEKLLLLSRDKAQPGVASYSCGPKEPIGLLFSPLHDPPDKPVQLTAADAWLGAMCDGLLTFSLGPGEHLAAPGYHFLQHQPAMLFAALVRGATFLHLELADLQRDPELLSEHPIRALGVCPALRELLLSSKTRSLKNVTHWFRNPEEPLDWKGWREWVRQFNLSQVPNANVLIDSTSGGAVASSLRRIGDIHIDAAPAAGRAWELRDVVSKKPAVGNVGIFTLLPDKKRLPGYAILSRIRDQFSYASTWDVRRGGRIYPAAEVVDAVQGFSFVAGASVFPVPTGGMLGHRYVLLIFTGAEPPELTDQKAGERVQELHRHLEQQLGPEFLPDRIEFFPLYPRRGKKGAIDDAWCRSQYVTGALHLKSKEPMFLALTAIRGRFLASEEGSGDDGPDA
jgi:hypothetical protein